jgi:hypothetical protein
MGEKMIARFGYGTVALALIFSQFPQKLSAQTESVHANDNAGRAGKAAKTMPWTFAVSGDSRNCGDVVMPALAAGVRKEPAAFYWHLGDLRKISGVDEDIAHQPAHIAKPLSMTEYEAMTWGDFIQSQMVPFGTLPVYLGIGNHETTPPKTREEFQSYFAKWLDRPEVRAQRLRDDPRAQTPRTYFRWIKGGVDFINLDNATADQFDEPQMQWFEATLRSDSADTRVRTVVVGMHEALPESIAEEHSMAQSAQGVASGRRAYADLLTFAAGAHKRVYILASHSHYYMDGIFNTSYWRENGGVLPGWIIGTAGAVRYKLPAGAESAANAAETDVYGFMTGAVAANGSIDFQFHRLEEKDVPPSVTMKYTPAFVHWCFAENSEAH